MTILYRSLFCFASQSCHCWVYFKSRTAFHHDHSESWTSRIGYKQSFVWAKHTESGKMVSFTCDLSSHLLVIECCWHFVKFMARRNYFNLIFKTSKNFWILNSDIIWLMKCSTIIVISVAVSCMVVGSWILFGS